MFRLFFIFLALFSLTTCLYAGDGFIVESIGHEKNIEYRKKLIDTILDSDAMHFSYRALSIIIDTNQREPRGKMQGKSITLSAKVAFDSEFIKLLVHEIGHYVDIYSLLPRDGRDASDEFYRISWSAKDTKLPGETLGNFVSGYAASNQYEDFAESFTFYVFHNREFATRALKNDSLRRKYLFFAREVFPGGKFSDTDFRTAEIPSYLWDTTKVPISVKKYLYSLKE